jgi:histone deacetylase 1/2
MMDVYVSDMQRPHHASAEELTSFHTPGHVKYLQQAEVSGVKFFSQHEKAREDCPIFENMFEFFQISSGASLDCATAINHGVADISINWAGGLHHAKRNEASGFCYVNDIVLAILELLKYHERVLYLDIDAHHGDGVEEAFYTTSRCMTVSFHKYGNFFPGTGDIKDSGSGAGAFHSLNVPLKSGMTDESYEFIFKPIMTEVMQKYQPNAVVCQCGSDSLAFDKLGKFNLTTRGHGDCIAFMKSFGLPMIILGGGGYTVANVARCWAYETSICLDRDISEDIPCNDYYQYYGPSFKLHVEADRTLHNHNTRECLENCVSRTLENLRMLEGAPSVQKHDIIPDFFPTDFQEHLQQGKQSESEFYDD